MLRNALLLLLPIAGFVNAYTAPPDRVITLGVQSGQAPGHRLTAAYQSLRYRDDRPVQEALPGAGRANANESGGSGI